MKAETVTLDNSRGQAQQLVSPDGLPMTYPQCPEMPKTPDTMEGKHTAKGVTGTCFDTADNQATPIVLSLKRVLQSFTTAKMFVAELANKNGFLADCIYTQAYYVQRPLTWLRNLLVTLSKVRAERLYPHRGLSSGANLQTAVTNICNAKCVFCAYPRAVKSGNLKAGVMSFE